LKTFAVKISKEIFNEIREDPLYHACSDSEILETMIQDWIFIFHGIEEGYKLDIKEASEG